MSLRPNSTAVNGAPSHSGVSRSINASSTRITPSIDGVDATTAIDLASPAGVGPRWESTTSARGPVDVSATNSIGSIIGCREQPTET
jgi:hypothetical protein